MGSLILVLTGGYLLILVLMFFFQNKLLFMPTAELIQTPESAGLTAEDVWIETEDGITIHGWYFPNDSAELVVILSHGNAGNISNRLVIAETLINSDASVLMYDYRGYGQSEGQPSEEGLYKDIDAVVNHLKRDYGYSEWDMVMYGRSLGGAVAAYAASKYDIRGLVLDSAFLNLREMVRDVYPFVPSALTRYSFPTDEFLKQIDPGLPIVIMHSPNDGIVRFENGQKLYELINDPKMFVELSGGHNDNFLSSRDIILQTWQFYIRGLCDHCSMEARTGRSGINRK